MPPHKKYFFTLFSLSLLILLTACGNTPPTQDEDTPEAIVQNDLGPYATELYIYTPKNMLDENTFGIFLNDYDIDVILQYYTTELELLDKIASSPSQLTLVVASNYMASVLKEKNALTAFDPSNVTNLTHIDGRFRNPAYDQYNQYCAAFTYGTVGIGYVNGQGVTPPTSWNDLYHLTPDSPAYGRVTLLDNPHEALATALLALGYDPNTTDESQIQAAKNLILAAAPSFAHFDSTNYWADLADNKTALAQGFSRDIYNASNQNPEVQYVFPSEGALLRPYNLCILQGVSPERKLSAELFVNFVLTPEYVENAVYVLKMPTTLMLNDLQLSQNILGNPLIVPPTAILNKSQYVYSAGPQETLYTIAWDEILNVLP